MSESEVIVKILGDATAFKKEVKEATKISSDLDKLSSRFRKSGLKDHKVLQKMGKNHNKSQSMEGKKAYALEKKLESQMKKTIKLMKAKQRAFKGNADAIKEEISQLRKLEQMHRKVSKHRMRTGYQGAGMRARGMAGMAGRGALGAMGGMAMIGGLVAGLGTAIVGSLATLIGSQISQGYSSYINYGRSRGGLAGMGNMRGGLTTDSSGNQGYATGTFATAQKLGFSATETVQQMRGVGRQTGNINAVNIAQGMARSFGGETGEMSQFMGTLTRAGQGFGGKMGMGGKRQLGQIMQHAFTSGLDKSRAGEHLTAVAQAVSSAQSVTAGKVDAAAISGLLGFFSRSGKPGLQGAAGLAQLGKFDSGIKGAGFGGGGDAATALIYQGLGYGTPGGASSFYDATKMAQRGIFGKGGAKNLLSVVNRVNQAGGGAGSEESNLMLSRMFGTSLDAVEGVQEVIAAGGTQEEVLAKIEAITKEQLPVDKQILEATKSGHLKVAERVAMLDNRLVGIGQANAEAVEQIQDVVNDVVDTFLPVAIDLLKGIADLLKYIWDSLKNFWYDYREHTGIRKGLLADEKAADVIMGRLRSGDITKEDARKQLQDLANKANSGEMAITRDVNPVTATLDMLGHAAISAGRATGVVDETTRSDHEERVETARRAARQRRRMLARARIARQGGPAQEERLDLEMVRGDISNLTGPGGGARDPEKQAVLDRLRERREDLIATITDLRSQTANPVTPPTRPESVTNTGSQTYSNTTSGSDGSGHAGGG